jgi:Flp pilus assembly protein CpaB
MRRGRLLIVVFLLVVVGLLAVVLVSGVLTPSEEAEPEIAEEPTETPTPVPTAVPTANILVAVQQLPRGLKIPPGAVDVREWPEDAIPVNAIRVPSGEDPQAIILQQVIGKIARSDIAIEQPILTTLLVPDLTQIAAEGSDAAAVLPQGLVAVAVPMNRLSGVAYAIQDGDRVDVILSFILVDVDEEFQSILPNQVMPVFFGTFTEEGSRTTTDIAGNACETANLDPSARVGPCTLGRIETIPPGELANVVPIEPQRPRLVSQRSVESALVIHVGEFPLDGRFISQTATPLPTDVPPTATPIPEGEEGAAPPPAAEEEAPPEAPTVTPTPTVPDIITLGVTPQDAVVLTWAINSGVDLKLALRSATDVPQVPTTSVTLQYMIETYNITVPPKLPYSLDPSIRDVGAGGELPTVTPGTP